MEDNGAERCDHCGSSRIGPKTRVTGHAGGEFGIEFKGPKKFIMAQTFETAFARVCLDCGTVRFFVENKDRDWGTLTPLANK